MIDFIVRSLFKWDALRTAIFEEVDLYNSLGLIFKDEDAMKIASSFWWDVDGWRGWTIKEDGRYYFNDLPEKSLTDVFDTFYVEDKVDN